MAKEIERKFLVKGEFRHLAVRELNIIQTYLSVDPLKSIRLRITDSSAAITIKSKIKEQSITRNEWEFPIPISDAKEMQELCIPGKIVKTRYIIPAEGRLKFEVDVFHEKNEGLVIAEIELSAEDEEFNRPEWLGEEVTGRPEYYNVNLIK
jgi:adenylate cyclase